MKNLSQKFNGEFTYWGKAKWHERVNWFEMFGIVLVLALFIAILK